MGAGIGHQMLPTTIFIKRASHIDTSPGLWRSARIGHASLLGLLLSSGSLLLLAGWWWFGKEIGDSSSGKAPLAVYGQTTSSQAGIDPSTLRIKSWHALDGLSHELAQFETVFWDPADTRSLRDYLHTSPLLDNGHVLEVGTGTGLISLFCAEHGAAHIVATDINPQAVANARYNADLFGVTDKLDVRLVPPDRPAPFSMIPADEKFSLIISNPPWEDAPVQEVAAYALYDPGFALLDGLLQQAAQHLQPGGSMLLAYGAKTAIERIVTTAPNFGWAVKIHDDRDLRLLPEVFVPGVLLELHR